MKIRTKNDLATAQAQPSDGPVAPAARWISLQQFLYTRRFLVAVCLVFMALLYAYFHKPLLPLPVPKELDKLEPQLRAYIQEQVAQAQRVPRQASSHATLGLVYAANALWPEAQAAFDNAIQLNPKEPLAYLYEAVAHQELGAMEIALQKLQQLTVKFPDFAPGFYRLGVGLARAGAFDQAAIAFRRLIELAPGEWRGFSGLGECQMRLGKVAEAARFVEKAVQLAPQEKQPHHLLGQMYQRLGRTEEAKQELRLGLDVIHYPMPDAWSVLAPQHMRLLQDQMDMAKDYTSVGKPEKAVQILATALSYNPTNLNLLNNLAIALNQSGQPAKAKDLLLKALQLDARYLPAHVALVESYLAVNQPQKALEHADRAIELSPQNAFPHISKANVLLALERDTEALAELETALRCDPQNATLQMELGDVCLRNLNRATEALEYYRKASELDPTFFPALIRLADVHLRLGHTDEARAALESARKLNPREPILNLLAERLSKMGMSRKE